MKHSYRHLVSSLTPLKRYMMIRKMNLMESLAAVLFLFGILTLVNLEISYHYYITSQTAILSSAKIRLNDKSTVISSDSSINPIVYQLDTQCKLVDLNNTSILHRVKPFHRIFHQQMWDYYSKGTGSERSSSIENAIDWIQHLQSLFQYVHIRSMADIPCGDVSWQFHVPEINTIEQLYFGGDISKHIIQRNQKLYASKHQNKLFHYWDLVHCPVPTFTYKNSTNSISGNQFDLIVVRNALEHMHIRNGLKALKNVVMSGAKFLALSTHPSNQISSADNTRSIDKNEQLPDQPINCSTIDYCRLGTIQEGSWYPNNINCYPFNFPLNKAIVVQPSHAKFKTELNEIHIYKIDEELQRIVQRYDQACLA